MKKKNILIIIFISLILIGSFIVIYFCFLVPNKEDDKANLYKQIYSSYVSSFEEENKEYQDKQVDVVFLGDSLTYYYDLKTYYPEYEVVNRGIGGDTTILLEGRMKISAYDLNPKAIVLLIGANNIYNMFDNYENILKGMKENLPETKVILVSLSAMGEGWKDYSKKNEVAALNNVKISLLAEKYNYTYVDIFSSLYDIDTGEIYKNYTIDGGHFSDEGYKVVTNEIKPVLENILN